MHLSILAISASLILANPFSTCWASQYSSGKMQQVIEYRQRVGQIPDDLSQYDGFVAGRYADEIGSAVWMRPQPDENEPDENGSWELFLVVDCAGVADGGLEWMLRSGVLYEIDYETAVRWDTVGYGVEVEVMGSSIGQEVE